MASSRLYPEQLLVKENGLMMALAVNHRCLVLPLGDVDPNDVHSVGSSHIQITDIPRAAEGHNLLRD